MPLKRAAAKRDVAEQVIVEEVEMTSGQPVDLSERVVYPLGVEGAAAVEERVLVAEVAVLRTSARDHDRVGDEVRAPGDEIAPDRRHAFERSPRCRDVASQWPAGAEVGEELRERLLAGPEKHGVGVRRGFVGKGRDVQAAQRDEDAFRAVCVRQGICASGVGDVDLNRHQIRTIVGRQRADMLVHDRGLVVRVEVGGEGGEPERGEQRVFDRPPVGTGGFGQRRQDQLDPQRPGRRRGRGACRHLQTTL